MACLYGIHRGNSIGKYRFVRRCQCFVERKWPVPVVGNMYVPSLYLTLDGVAGNIVTKTSSSQTYSETFPPLDKAISCYLREE